MSNKESSVATLGDEQNSTAPAETPVAPRAGRGVKSTPIESDDAAAVKALQNQGFSGERRTITLPARRDDSEQDFVFVSVNGYAFQIPRGKPFLVPAEVIEVLDNAVETRYDGTGTGREVPRHQFSVR